MCDCPGPHAVLRVSTRSNISRDAYLSVRTTGGASDDLTDVDGKRDV